MAIKEQLLGNLLYVIPKNWLSYLVGKLVHVRLPQPLALWSVMWFAKRYRIDLSEAELPAASYPSIGQLFTRRLKPGIRPILGEVVHPADSKLTQRGLILKGLLYQVKGWSYTAEEFLGSSDVKVWEGGHYMTYYLCPTDYHRVHSAVSGQITEVRYIPGALWPVNDWSVNSVKNLFVKNERLVFHIATEKGPVVIVMVGATNVGKMTVSFDVDWVTNLPWIRQGANKVYSPGIRIKAGDELGVFHMGSTAVVLYPPGFFSQNLPNEGVIPVRLGEKVEDTTH